MIAPNNEQPQESEPPGGIGGNCFIDQRTGGRDLQLVRRAIREDWPIPAGVRKLLVEELGGVLKDGEDERNKISAAKALIAADAVNARREAMDQADEHHGKGTVVRHEHSGSVSFEQRRVELLAIIADLRERGDDTKNPAITNGTNGPGE